VSEVGTWQTLEFGRCADLVNGRAYAQTELLESGPYQVIRIQNLNGGSNWYYSDLELESDKYCESGDLLFAWSATFGPYVWSGEKAIFHYHIWKVLPKPELLDKEFAYFLLLWITAKIKAAAHGIAMLHFTKEGMEGYKVAIPPIATQRRLAARLEAQLVEVDCARQAMKRQTSDIALLRRSVLRAAFDALLDRYDPDVCLKDVCSISAGGTPSRGAVAFFNGSIPWVKTLDLNFGIVTDTEEKISQQALLSIRGELLPVGTVLVAMYGGAGTIGKSGILGIEACTNQAICAMQPKADELDSAFLHEWLCYIRPEWMRLAGGNRKDPNINKSIVENMTLPLPPLDEQRVFAKRLRLQLAEVNAIAETAAAQLSELSRLAQRLLAQAFEN
jgi:type I restriction enzyme S subunit